MTSLIALSFAFNKAEKTLPKELGSLVNLVNFYTANNKKLTGTIPAEYKNMVKLVGLDVSNCDLSGDIPTGLFADMEDLSLVNFQGGEKGFTGAIPLGTLLGKSTMRSIDFSNNEFTSAVVPAAGVRCATCERLILNNNKIKSPISFVTTANFPKLEELDLSVNEFSGKIAPLPATLQKLALNNNTITGSFPDGVIGNAVIEEVNIGNNKGLSGTIPKEFSPRLKDKPKFKVLKIGNTAFSQISFTDAYADLEQLYAPGLTGGVTVSDKIFASPTMEQLVFDGSTLSHSPIIIDHLKMKNLKVLKMSGTGISWQIPDGWFCFGKGYTGKLEELDLSKNKLSGPFPSFMLDNRCGNCKVEEQRLAQIDLSFQDGKNFDAGPAMEKGKDGKPPTLRTCIKSLVISKTARSGDMSQFIIGHTNELQVLKVGDNNLGGAEFPKSWENLNKLDSLGLENNKDFKACFPDKSVDCKDAPCVDWKAKATKLVPDGKSTELTINVQGDTGVKYDSKWIDTKDGKLPVGFQADKSILSCGIEPDKGSCDATVVDQPFVMTGLMVR